MTATPERTRCTSGTVQVCLGGFWGSLPKPGERRWNGVWAEQWGVCWGAAGIAVGWLPLRVQAVRGGAPQWQAGIAKGEEICWAPVSSIPLLK